MFLCREPDAGVAWRSFTDTTEWTEEEELLRSQRDIAPSVSVITNLAADWTETRNSLLAEREKERAEVRNHSQPGDECRAAFQQRSKNLVS